MPRYPLRLPAILAAIATAGQAVGAAAFTWAPRADVPFEQFGVGLHAGGTINDRIYIAGGGYLGASGLAESYTGAGVYNPARDQWTRLPAMSVTRTGPAGAVANFQGLPRFYVVGGMDWTDIAGGFISRPSIEEYDPVGNSWRVVGTAMPAGIYSFGTCAVTLDNRIYILGGADDVLDLTDRATAYDPDTDSFATLRPMPGVRSDGACAVWGRKIYYFGGYDARGWGTLPSDTVLVYDVDTDTWTTDPGFMPLTRADFAAVVVAGTIYLIGGWDGSGTYFGMRSAIDAYDPATGQWTPSVPDPLGCVEDDGASVRGRSGLSLHLANDGTATRLYAVGGTIGVSIPTRCNESSPQPIPDNLPPVFAGAQTAVEEPSCASPPAPRVRLEWLAATDPSAPVAYNVYRGASPAFVPDPTNRIATRVSGISYTDSLASADCFQSYWYVVRAEDSASPPNEDQNLNRLQVDLLCPQAPVPAAIGNLLRAVRDPAGDPALDWGRYVPAAGVHYHVRRTLAPPGLPGNILAEVPLDRFYTDGSATGNFYLYQIRAANSCEIESSE